jgi:glutamyl-Q tRNA(Asp) synthetase
VHLHLQQLLGLSAPRYAHLPIVVNEKGQKLSKQTRARAVDATRSGVGQQALSYLGLDVPAELAGAAPAELWEWAVSAWTPDTLRGRAQIHEKPPPLAASAMLNR